MIHMLLNESGIMDALNIFIQNFPSVALNKLLRYKEKQSGKKVDSSHKVNNLSKENIQQMRNESPPGKYKMD